MGKKEAKDALPAITQKPILTDRVDRSPNNRLAKAPLCRLREMRRHRESQYAQEVDEEEDNDQVEDLEATSADFSTCTVCTKTLSENEKLINTRFINEGMAVD